MAKSGGRAVTGGLKMIKWALAIVLIVLVLQDLPSAEAKKSSRRCLYRLCKVCKRYHYSGRSRRSVNNETALLGDGKEGFDIDDRSNSFEPSEEILDDNIDDSDDKETTSLSPAEAIKKLLVHRKQYLRQRTHAVKQCRAYKNWRRNFHQARPLYNGTSSGTKGSKMDGNHLACQWLRHQVNYYKDSNEASVSSLLSEGAQQNQLQLHQKRSTTSHRMRCLKVIQSWCCRKYFEVYLIGYRYKS